LEPFRERNTLLDIGCGPGYFLEEARSLGWNPIGIEPSRSKVEFAAERGLEVLQGTADDIRALTDGEFDVVTFWDAFEHLADPMGVLALVHSVLRPAGVVLMRLPDASALSVLSSLSIFERPLYSFYVKHVFPWYPDRHLYHYSPETLSNMLMEAGFSALGSWIHETIKEKVSDASGWWKRQLKRAILEAAVHRGWPHEFVQLSVRRCGGC
jgi:SAM-dependent methyltransferase